MLKTKHVFLPLVYSLMAVMFLFVIFVPKSVVNAATPAAEISIKAKADSEQADKDVVTAKATALELKKISTAAASLAKVAKTEESKVSAAKAKADYDKAEKAVTAAIKKAAVLKKAAMLAAKAAKVEVDAIAKAVATPMIKACVRSAAATREKALIAARTIYNQNTLAAYTVRADALDKAYSTEGVILKTETLKIWSAFKGSLLDATKKWKTVSTDAWKVYSADVKVCKATIDLTDGSSQGLEAKGE